MLMNASMLKTYVSASTSYENFFSRISELVKNEVELKKRKIKPSVAQRHYLYWLLGLTQKGIQNILREDETLSSYLEVFDRNLDEMGKEMERSYGRLAMSIKLPGEKSCRMEWPSFLRCMLAIGSQTLAIRGSEKSVYGKLFEKFVLGSVLTLLGASYINKDDTSRNDMVFWLSEREEKRESDATLLLRPGSGIRFDIGFIGKGNTEVSLDKVSRFERFMERGGITSSTITIILIDRIGNKSRIKEMAKSINGHIIQMSGTYWVYELAQTIKQEFDFYDHPILHSSPEKSLDFLKSHISEIDLNQFLHSVEFSEEEEDID